MKTTIAIALTFALLVGLIPTTFGQKYVPSNVYDFPKCLGLVSDGKKICR
jgi:hypothetical protein